MLTEASIRAVQPGGKTVRLTDGGGLYIQVTPNGNRWWRFVYRFDGKQNRLSFGVFPGVSLRRARAKRDTALRQLAQGIDPGEARREARRAGDWKSLQALLR